MLTCSIKESKLLWVGSSNDAKLSRADAGSAFIFAFSHFPNVFMCVCVCVVTQELSNLSALVSE